MDIISEKLVPEYALEVRRRLGVRRRAHRPVAGEYYASGEYPWDVLEAATEAGLVAQDIGEEWDGSGYDSSRAARQRNVQSRRRNRAEDSSPG